MEQGEFKKYTKLERQKIAEELEKLERKMTLSLPVGTIQSEVDTRLKRLARESELEIIEYPDGRVLVVGGLVNVHWWPQSKGMTAYAEGATKGRRHMTPKLVIRLANEGT